MKRLFSILALLAALPVAAQTGGAIRPIINLAPTCSLANPSGVYCGGYERTWCVVDISATEGKAYRCSPTYHKWIKYAELDTSTVPTHVALADALAANGANCSIGSAPLGVNATGAAEGCTAYQLLSAYLTAQAALGLCPNGQFHKSNGTADVCSADATGGSPTLDTVGSGTNNSMVGHLDTGASLDAINGGVLKASDVACGSACIDMATEIGPFASSSLANRITDEVGTGHALFDTDSVLLGNPIAPTPATSDNDTSVATTAMVQAARAALASDTQTLTNKSYDSEATGNTLSVPMKLWLPAAGCQASTSASFWDNLTANPAVAACVTGTNTQKGVLDFDAATNQFAQATLLLPGDWVGTADVKLKWLAAATSGNVIWGIQTSCVADAETDDPSWNTASTVTDAAKGTTLQTNDASITGITTTGCAAGELLHVNIYRDAAAGGDTMTGNARLIGIELTLRRAI